MGSCLMGRVGVGEAVNPREEREGQSAGMLIMWRHGGAQYVIVPSLGAMKLCFEVRDGQ
jgi:hypothetical protein